MKMFCIAFLLAFAATTAVETKNPIQKVISMISDLEAKTIKEGETAQHTYEEFSEFCEERSKELGFEIKTGSAEKEDLEATISKATADIQTYTTKIEEVTASIATAEADLKAATEVREKEAKDFEAEEAALVQTVEETSRAATVLENEMSSGASMVQLKNAKSVTQALNVLVQASAISTSDSQKLAALVQTASNSDDSDSDSDDALGAPAAAATESHSGGILDTIKGLLDRAETQLQEARDAETKAQNDFTMLKQSLEDTAKFGGHEMKQAKKDLAAAEETKGTAEGDLSVTAKDLAEDKKVLSEVHHDCMEKANAFEVETTARGEELKALATAKKVIMEATGGESKAYSFLQVSEPSSHGLAVVHMVRRLAKKHHSTALAQLATHMSAAVRYGSGDPFGKVKGLIMDMISKLEEEAEADAKKQGFCTKEMSETEANKADKDAEIEKLSTKIDQMTTESEKLKEEVAVLQKELANLAQTQATMDKLRAEEKAEYEETSAELKTGLAGIKMALKVLRDYYAKGDASANSDAGSGIISMLEVVESDLTKESQEVESAESMAVTEYEETTKENSLEKTTKDQDVKYKGKEAKSLDEGVAELSGDRSAVQTELDAVLEYFAKIKAQCIEKTEPYEEKKKRREEEIAGLKDALQVLESEAALIQKGERHSTLRGVKIHRA